MKEGKKEEAEIAKQRVAEIKEVNKAIQAEMDQAAEDMQNLLYTIPNVPYAQVPNVCKHIHLPVQSGSSRILKLMNRKYTREWYLDRVAAIKRIIPDCGLTTDIFSGFHSETEEDHQLSLSLMEECGYDAAFMFKYSERPGTYASKHLEDNVPEDVKVRRLNEIIALQNRLSAESNQRCIGKTYEVLVEGVSKRSRDQLFGRTEQNRVVVFDRGTHRIGDFVNVRVTEASSATLKGEEV